MESESEVEHSEGEVQRDEVAHQRDRFTNYTLENCPMFSLNGLKTYGRVVDIVDGDTMKIIIQIFDKRYFRFNVRLDGIDTSEMKSKDSKNKQKAIEARDAVFYKLSNQIDKITNEVHQITHQITRKITQTSILDKHAIKDYLQENCTIVWIECFNFDKYGRLLANVYDIHNKDSISEYLLKHNLAYIYTGKTKLTEEEINEIL
jgi:endonuclease YncB( thermonuclease family)